MVFASFLRLNCSFRLVLSVPSSVLKVVCIFAQIQRNFRSLHKTGTSGVQRPELPAGRNFRPFWAGISGVNLNQNCYFLLTAMSF